MKRMILTTNDRGARRSGMTARLLPICALFALGGCIQVQAPEKPIEINLNVNIKQEVVYKLQQDAEDLITNNPELFPQ